MFFENIIGLNYKFVPKCSPAAKFKLNLDFFLSFYNTIFESL